MNKEKLLTIGMATYDDYDGVFFSIQSLRMHHPICSTDQVEFIVLDNNPNGKHGVENQNLIKYIPGGKYVKNEGEPASWTKYKIPDYASGKYIIIMDCHVLLVPNAIDKLLEYYQQTPDCKNLIQGPLLYNNLKNVSTHWNPEWRGDMYGTWAFNKEMYEKGDPFIIPMQGMGCMSFEKTAWHGINPHLTHFGGEQGYISEKFRSWGGENLCLPSFKWVHRFGRPAGVKYPLSLEDRAWNYFIGWMDIYKNVNHPKILEIYNYFKNKLPEGAIDRIYKLASETWDKPK